MLCRAELISPVMDGALAHIGARRPLRGEVPRNPTRADDAELREEVLNKL